MHKPIKAKITGFGHYRPQKSRLSSELDTLFNQPIGWTKEKFSISERAIASRKETTSFMAARACEEALKMASWDDFDVLIGGCGVMEQPIPSTSVFVQKELGLEKSGIKCFDVNMTCLSFLSAFEIAAQYIATGMIKRALIFASDIASCGLDYSQPHASAIFGDGAAAICLEAHDDENCGLILASNFKTYSSGIDTAHLRSGGTKIRIDDGYEALKEGAKFYMDAFGIFRAAGKYLPRTLSETLKMAQVSLEEIDVVIAHQASAPGLEFLRNVLKTRPERVVDIFDTFGNQIAASLPNALYHAHKTGMLKTGSNVLLLGTSAGISIGAMVIRI